MNTSHFDSNHRSRCLAAAGIAGATAVLFGAFGAHWLPSFLAESGLDAETIERRIGQFETGARYHLAHSVALLALACLPIGFSRAVRWAVVLMVAGIVLFSGSLYLLVLTNTPVFGAVTPLGGLSWILAWALIAWTGFVGNKIDDKARRI